MIKRPWRDGTAGMGFEPVDFLAKLATLVPPPRMHLLRFHGVYAPSASLRPQVVPPLPDEEEENAGSAEEPMAGGS